MNVPTSDPTVLERLQTAQNIWFAWHLKTVSQDLKKIDRGRWMGCNPSISTIFLSLRQCSACW